MKKRTIIFDVERMRYPFTGLYYYCLFLSQALISQQNLHTPQLNLYAPKNSEDVCDANLVFSNQQFFHKYIMPRTLVTDIWHCTFQGSNYFPNKKNVKIILTIHDLNFLYEKKANEKILKYKRALQSKIDSSKKIITISQFVKNDLIKNFSVDENKINVIYNGCNIIDSNAEEAPETLPSSFLFTIGFITEKKNFHVLLPLLINTDYLLVIAGIVTNESYKEKIIAEAKKLNVEKQLVFTGSISEKQKNWYLKNCLAFVFPSLAEGFGLPVIEAMHFGKPVILSKATSLPEIGGEHAYYFNSFEPAEMQENLQSALRDYSKNNNADKIINWSKKFNWQTTAQQHWDLYENVLKDV